MKKIGNILIVMFAALSMIRCGDFLDVQQSVNKCDNIFLVNTNVFLVRT